MPKQLVFIDDSGDPGFKETSSRNFVMAAAVFIDSGVADDLSKRIDERRKLLQWRKNIEFKFSKDRKEIIGDLLKVIRDYNFDIYAVYLNKSKCSGIMTIINKNKLYDWMIVELLKLLPANNMKVKIDGRSGRQNMRKTAAYLRRELRGRNRKLEIDFEDSRKNNLIQVADLVAGSINRSLETSKTDARKYINILKDRVKLIKEITV